MKTVTLYRLRPEAEGYSENLPRNEWHDADWWRKNLSIEELFMFNTDGYFYFDHMHMPHPDETNRLIALIEYTLNGLAMESPANKQIATEIVNKWLNGEEVTNG